MAAGCKRKGRNGLGSPRRRKPDRERIAREENAESDRRTLIVNSWDAAGYELGFGKHKGKTLGQVGETDEGLQYIVWMAQLAERMRPQAKLAARAYLNLPVIVARLYPPPTASSPDIHSTEQVGQPTKEPVPELRVQTCDPPFIPGSHPYRLVG
jgi:hypothetical protein